jgi:hypothetical protein
LILAAGLVVATGSAIAGEGAHRSQSAFLGFWEGIDPLDGSSVQLSISNVDRDGTLDIIERETFFTVCFELGDSYSLGRGLISGEGKRVGRRTLDVEIDITCIDNANNLAEARTARETYTLASRSVLVVAPDLPDVPDIVLHRISR